MRSRRAWSGANTLIRALAVSRSRRTPSRGGPARCTAYLTVDHWECAAETHVSDARRQAVVGDQAERCTSLGEATLRAPSASLGHLDARCCRRRVQGGNARPADRLESSNPCDGTGLPKVPRQQIEPLPTETVWALVEAVPPRYRALVILAAGTGMRQGEALGLTVDRIDFLRRVVRVDQQLLSVPGREPFLAPPKTAASVRTIPLPQVVIDALAAHLAAYPPSAAGLVFTTGTGAPVRRSSFGDVWRAAVKAAGAPPGTGIHQLRHYYASLLIRHGESVKVVQARLGRASASQTLDTYSHLWPDSDDRTRTAVDSVLSADNVRTEGVVDGRTP